MTAAEITLGAVVCALWAVFLILEVEQPASDFVFRVSEGRGGAPVFKLVAADGGVWKSQAVANVKAYLVEALKDIPDRDKITIIA